MLVSLVACDAPKTVTNDTNDSLTAGKIPCYSGQGCGGKKLGSASSAAKCRKAHPTAKSYKRDNGNCVNYKKK